MKFKVSIICLLLISIYCLSTVCAADLNQTADDIKTNDENDDSVVLNDYNSDVSVYDGDSTKNDDADWARIEKLIELDDGVKPTQQARVDDGVKPIQQLVMFDDNITLCNFTPMLPNIPVFPKDYTLCFQIHGKTCPFFQYRILQDLFLLVCLKNQLLSLIQDKVLYLSDG